jgi:hypothetical protein
MMMRASGTPPQKTIPPPPPHPVAGVPDDAKSYFS